ncbi:RHTO0S04e11936g2_1 [Rhodotorula toruloides]|uniref:RHTO0S04e11936g2_1 n=1 Tax=Rhodotorula toruloides TaxID=5286 RepID=A0A061AYV0_RHOTO|nr:RHTO0S04e11936g2_1 [Rhodotorula toruloides]
MSVLSSPLPLAWSTPLSFSPSSSAGRGAVRKKRRSASRPGLVEKRESSSSSTSSSSSSSLDTPDEPLTPPSDSPSPFLASSSHSPFFSSSTKSPTAFLEYALDSSALPRVSKDVKGRRGRRARSLSPPSSSGSWTRDREVMAWRTRTGTKQEGVRRSEKGRQRTRLPEGWEHIPWITSSSSSDDDDLLLEWTTPRGRSRSGKEGEEDEDRPPSPPKTPSPRLFERGPILDVPLRPSPLPTSSSAISTRRRSVTRSDLPSLRFQLSPSPPRSSAKSTTKTGGKSRSAPTSPTKPRCEIVELSTTGEGEGEGEERRRRRKSLREKEGSGRRRAREERVEGREDDQREEFGAYEVPTEAPGLGITIPSPSTDGTFATRPSSSSSSCHPSLSPSCSCDSTDSSDSSPDASTIDHFHLHFQSLPLLRLRHALSLASTLASLPSTSLSSQRHLSTPRPSHFTRTSILGSEQYRLYAMGRAKAERTGGVGYWEGGREVWAAVLES